MKVKVKRHFIINLDEPENMLAGISQYGLAFTPNIENARNWFRLYNAEEFQKLCYKNFPKVRIGIVLREIEI